MLVRARLGLLVLLLSSCGGDEPGGRPDVGGADAGSGPSGQPLPAASFQRLDPNALLVEGWHPGTMLVVQDWHDLEALETAQRATAEMMREPMRNQGVAAAAELSWSRKQMPIDMLSVRVLAFEDAAKMSAWRQAKFGGVRGSSLVPVEDATFEAYDVRVEGKRQRIAFLEQIYVSCHHLLEGDVHVEVLEATCAQLLGR